MLQPLNALAYAQKHLLPEFKGHADVVAKAMGMLVVADGGTMPLSDYQPMWAPNRWEILSTQVRRLFGAWWVHRCRIFTWVCSCAWKRVVCASV